MKDFITIGLSLALASPFGIAPSARANASDVQSPQEAQQHSSGTHTGTSISGGYGTGAKGAGTAESGSNVGMGTMSDRSDQSSVSDANNQNAHHDESFQYVHKKKKKRKKQQ